MTKLSDGCRGLFRPASKLQVVSPGDLGSWEVLPQEQAGGEKIDFTEMDQRILADFKQETLRSSRKKRMKRDVR